MRLTYLEIPEGSLANAKSVLLDWNISARIEHLHRLQLEGRPIDPTSPDSIRLANLADSIPDGAVVISGLGASEPEVRRESRPSDIARYNRRADTAAFYLSGGKRYLHSLIAGGPSGGLVIESDPDLPQPVSLDPIRRILAVSYAALLKAVEIDLRSSESPVEKVDELRFFLERQLVASPSREGWVGFMLLGGKPEYRARARRLLKLDKSDRLLDSIWGAAWDLMYTRMPSVVELSGFRGLVPLPLAFVTDDAALPEVLAGLTPTGAFRTEHGEMGGEFVDFSVMRPEVAALLDPYMTRDGRRIALHSKGLTRGLMSRGMREATKLERSLGSLSRIP